MALFYILAELTTATRAAYYLAELLHARSIVKGVFTVLPSNFMLGMVIG